MTGTRTYLETLFEPCLTGDKLAPDTEIEVRSFRAGRGLHSYKSASTIPAALRLIEADSAANGDVYNGVHLRRRGCGKGGDANVEVLTAVIADIDIAKAGITWEAAMTAARSTPYGTPTMIVNSGGGIHVYWCYAERVEASDETHAEHRRLCAYIRSWFNKTLKPAAGWLIDKRGKPVLAADDMSSRDRILRPPGTRNFKPAHAVDGVQPVTKLLELHEESRYSVADLVTKVEPGFNPDSHAKKSRSRKRARAHDASLLPTSVPERIRRALTAGGIGYKAMGDASGIFAIKLFPCPACGQSDGGCYLTPKRGSLRTYHQQSCPAAYKPGGIPLEEWVERYTPQAAPGLARHTPISATQLTRGAKLGLSISGFDWALPANSLADLSESARLGSVLTDCVWVSSDQVEGLPPSGPGAAPRRIASCAPDGGVLLPLRDGAGQVRQGVWLNSGELLPGRIGFNRGDDAVTGSVLVLGNLPNAIARSGEGESLYIAYGPRDYLALLGMLAQIEDSSPAIGLVGHVGDVVTFMVDGWTRAQVRPDRVVVFSTSARGHDDLKRFDGSAGTVWLDLAAGGLDGTLKAPGGIKTVRRRLGGSRWLYKPPANILKSAERIMQDIKHAAMLTAHTSKGDRPTLVIYTPPPGTGKSTLSQLFAGEIATGRFTIPIRGRRPRGYPKEQWPPKERSVAFATPTHALSIEKFETHEQLGVPAPRERYAGALSHCHYAKEDNAAAKSVSEAYPHVGRRGICGDKGSEQRCEYADQGCPGAVQPVAKRGEISYVTEAMAVHMKWDFCFVDENTGVVRVDDIDQAAIATLYAGKLHPRVKVWRMEGNTAAPDAARLICQAFAPLARQHGADVGAGRVPSYPRRITGEDLCRLLETDTLLCDLLEDGYHPKAKPPPTPFPAELRSGHHAGRHMPSVQAFRVLQALRNFRRRVRRLDEDPSGLLPLFKPVEAPKPIVILQLNPDGTWQLEQRQVKRLPKAPTVLLDATGELTLAEYRAAYPDHRVQMMGMSVWGAQPRAAIHIPTKGVSRTALHDSAGRLTPKAARLLRKLVLVLANNTRRAYPRGVIGRDMVLGLLVYKSVFDAIEGRSHSPLNRLKAELLQRGIQIRAGYFGRDDRGTNRFENVDGLAVIGDARPNLGDVEADCMLLGLDALEVMSARAEAVVVQAVFRARHTRRSEGREPVILLASSKRPHITGIVWDVVELAGGPSTDSKALAYEMLTFVGAEHGVVGLKAVELFDWSDFGVPDPLGKTNRHAMAAAVKEFLSERPSWKRYQASNRVTGRPYTVWAESEKNALIWAITVARASFIRGRASAENLYDIARRSEAGRKILNDYGILPSQKNDAGDV